MLSWLAYLILIMFKDIHAQFMMGSHFLTEQGLISANGISRNGMNTDLS